MNPGLPDEQSFPLHEGTLTIGRTKDNDIFCLHKSLSRKHARLEVEAGTVHVVDLQSKNGIFHNGRRVGKCEVADGESFRCGDITFLVEGAESRPHPKLNPAAQTLPSPFALEANLRRATKPAPAQPPVMVEDENRYKDKLFLLIRASELLVGELAIDKALEELIVLAVQVLEVDRIVVLTLDDETRRMKPRVVKSFVGGGVRPYSSRVVEWVVANGRPASFADVSQDRALPGDAAADAHVKGALCVPINPGGGTLGVIYADSISQPNAYRADDLALLRALANMAAVAIESDTLRRLERLR